MSLKSFFSIVIVVFCLLPSERSIGAQSEASPYRPSINKALLALQPANWDKFIVPVSVHIACADNNVCVTRHGADFNEAYFARLLTTMSADFSPPNNGFFQTRYKGIEFVLANFNKVVSPEIYNWTDHGDANVWVRQLVDKGDQTIDGYFNIFVTGDGLCGVAGGYNLRLNNGASIFIGRGCLSDDDPALGIYGSSVLTHETMHAIGMTHIVDTTPQDIAFRHPECGSDFSYKLYDRSHSFVDAAGQIHPERNHFMGSNTTGLRALEVQYGRPSLFTAESYSTDPGDEAFSQSGEQLLFPARYDFASEALIACWAYQNFVLEPTTRGLKSYPMIKLTAPAVPGAWLVDTPVLVEAEVRDWNDADVLEVRVAVDSVSDGLMHLAGSSQQAYGHVRHYEYTLDSTKYQAGQHELQIEATDANGVTGWQSQPVVFSRPPADGCVRFEACVDGSDKVIIRDGHLRLEHRHAGRLGQLSDCANFHSRVKPSLSLYHPGSGVFVVDGKPFPAVTVAGSDADLAVDIKDLYRVSVIEARGNVQFDKAQATVLLDDDTQNGSGPYVLDLCE